MAVRIRACDRTLVGNHVHSREKVLGSNPTPPNLLTEAYASTQHFLRNAPLKGHRTRYVTLFFKGIHSVISLLNR